MHPSESNAYSLESPKKQCDQICITVKAVWPDLQTVIFKNVKYSVTKFILVLCQIFKTAQKAVWPVLHNSESSVTRFA